MSYCRWSSDGFRCDLYAYEDVGGEFVIHVAKYRSDPPAPLMPWECGEQAMTLWKHAYKGWSETRKLVPIGLPHDGAIFSLDSEDEMFQKMHELRCAGYLVPEWVFPCLDDTQS